MTIRRTFVLLSTIVLLSVGCADAPRSTATIEPVENEPAGAISDRGDSMTSNAGTSNGTQSSENNNSMESSNVLAGTWKVDTIEFRGESRQPQDGMPETVEISDGFFNAFSGESPIGPFSQLKMGIRPRTGPDELDLVRKKDEGSESLPCIFEVTGEQLRIAMPMVPANKSPEDSLPRPASFDTNEGPFMVLSATRCADPAAGIENENLCD